MYMSFWELIIAYPNGGHWLHHCLQDRIISLLQVVHTAKYLEVGASYKNCGTDICFQNKNRSFTSSEILNPVPYFSKHLIQSYRSFTGTSSQCFEAPTASKFVADAEFLQN